MANWRKTKTAGVYVAHQRRCPAFAAASARCRCEPSWRGRRHNPLTGKPEWQKPVTKDRSEVLSWLAAARQGADLLRESRNDGLNWPHCDGFIWPHLRPMGGSRFELRRARTRGAGGNGIQDGVVRADQARPRS